MDWHSKLALARIYLPWNRLYLKYGKKPVTWGTMKPVSLHEHKDITGYYFFKHSAGLQFKGAAEIYSQH